MCQGMVLCKRATSVYFLHAWTVSRPQLSGSPLSLPGQTRVLRPAKILWLMALRSVGVPVVSLTPTPGRAGSCWKTEREWEERKGKQRRQREKKDWTKWERKEGAGWSGLLLLSMRTNLVWKPEAEVQWQRQAALSWNVWQMLRAAATLPSTNSVHYLNLAIEGVAR